MLSKTKRITTALLGACLVSACLAQSYPERPIRLINPYAAGGSADVVSRIIATPLGQLLGTTVVVENKGGAGGAVGTAEASRAPADGYTLAIASVGSMVIIPETIANPGYLPSDFIPITNIAATPNIIAVHPSFSVKTARDFIAQIKAHPRQYSYATSGMGGINHMMGESFQALTGTELVHIPYRGSGPAVSAVVAGQVPILVDQLPSSRAFLEAGRLQLIGVIAPQRLASFPDVPTFEEIGLTGFTDQAWYGLLAPAQTPEAVITKLSEAMQQVLANPAVRTQLENAGANPVGSSPAAFDAQLKAEREAIRQLVKTRKLSLQE